MTMYIYIIKQLIILVFWSCIWRKGGGVSCHISYCIEGGKGILAQLPFSGVARGQLPPGAKIRFQKNKLTDFLRKNKT